MLAFSSRARGGEGLLLVAALYVTADALREPAAAERFLLGLTIAAAVAALVGLLQVGLCPAPGTPPIRPRWLYHRCDRAHGFFSIYMTLAGVLSLVLLATLQRLLSPGPCGRAGSRCGGSGRSWASARVVSSGSTCGTPGRRR